MQKIDEKIRLIALKLVKIAYWSVRDVFKVVWVTLLLTCLRLWKLPRREHGTIRRGQKLRICIISEYYYPVLGGITEHVYNFARRLIMKGHDVSLLTSHAGDPGARGHLEGLRIHRVGRSKEIYSNGSIARMTFGWRVHREVEKFFAENEFDMVHIHSPVTPTLPLLCPKYVSCPVVGTYHTDFDKSAALSFWRRGAQLMLDHMDAVVTVSPVSATAMRRYLNPKGKTRLIPNGVDTEWFYRREARIDSLDDGRPNILYIGRFDPRNGFSTMIRAFEIVKRSVSDARLVVIGYGPLCSYYMSKIPGELTKDIVFVGKCDLERPQYYSSSDVICVPAKKAACSVAILEAMATATPIVASDIDGFRWIIEHEKEALLVRQGDAESFAGAIVELLRNAELRERICRGGLEKAAALDWKVLTDDILELYYDVLEALPAEAGRGAHEESAPLDEHRATPRGSVFTA